MGQLIYLDSYRERNKIDVHTEHCCIHCGCKYGQDAIDWQCDITKVECSVVSGRKKQAAPCSQMSTCHTSLPF